MPTPPQFKLQAPQNVTVFGDRVFREVIKVQWITSLGSNPNDWYSRGDLDRHAQKKTVKTRVEGGCPQAKERCLRKQPCRILILDFQPLCRHYFSVAKLCLTLWDPMDSSTTVKPPLSFTISQSLLRFTSTEVVMLSKHLMLCHPLLLLPSILPSIGVFSNESALCIK